MSKSKGNAGWELYQFPPSFVLGFHGCDKAIGEAILHGEVEHLEPSRNDYDWLGSGIYFWQANPQRALEFAQERVSGKPVSKGDIKEPFVLGAVINLGFSLDMSNSSSLEEVRWAYDDFVLSLGDEPIPQNAKGLKLRLLDCAVFTFLHERRKELNLRPYDTVVSTYREGNPLYPGTDLNQQDHTQICVCNTASILGYFRPIQMK